MKGVYNIFKASMMSNHQAKAIWMVQVANSWIKNKAEAWNAYFCMRDAKDSSLGLGNFFF